MNKKQIRLEVLYLHQWGDNMQIISVIDSNDFVQQVSFDGVMYRLHFAYNSYIDQWSLDIRDNSNNDIVRGISIVPNFPLLAQYRRHNNIKGELVAAVVNDSLKTIGRNDFKNGKASLIWVTEAEYNELVG